MPSAGGLKQLSPFVVKVEMALLYLGLEFEVEHIAPQKIRSMSPTGKVPWIRMGESTLSESDSIITFLNSKQDVDLFDGLTNDQKVLGLALKRLTEDHMETIDEILGNKPDPWVGPGGDGNRELKTI